MSDTDLELLARYTRHRAEDAFAEIVRRHLALVHSAALRQVRSPQLAEEVAQSTFLKLAQHARQLAPDTILSAWLYQVTRREAIDVVRREARRQLREQIATEMTAMNATDADWTHIEPLLDEAMHALDETDRAAVLLRYFENKSLREVGQALGASENAAQKRLTRAVEQLREFFAKRGVSVGASGLVVIISANAIQAAPVGLAITILSTTAISGTTFLATATATTTKAIAMTTGQKTLIGVVLAAIIGVAVYEARVVSTLRGQVQTLQQQQAPPPPHVEHSSSGSHDAISKLAALRAENDRLRQGGMELLRMRGELSMLRQRATELSNQVAKSSNPYGLQPGQMPPVRSSSVPENARAYANLVRKAASGQLTLAEEYNLAKAWPYLERKFREPADFAYFQAEYLAALLDLKDENTKWELRRAVETARDAEHKNGLKWARMSKEEIQQIDARIDMNRIRSQWNQLSEQAMTVVGGLLTDTQRELLAASLQSVLDFDPRLRLAGENVPDDPRYQNLNPQEVSAAFFPKRPGVQYVPVRAIEAK